MYNGQTLITCEIDTVLVHAQSNTITTTVAVTTCFDELKARRTPRKYKLSEERDFLQLIAQGQHCMHLLQHLVHSGYVVDLGMFVLGQ